MLSAPPSYHHPVTLRGGHQHDLPQDTLATASPDISMRESNKNTLPENPVSSLTTHADDAPSDIYTRC